MSEFIESAMMYFYGDYWFIGWGVCLLFFVIGFSINLPKLIKSIKETKKRREG